MDDCDAILIRDAILYAIGDALRDRTEPITTNDMLRGALTAIAMLAVDAGLKPDSSATDVRDCAQEVASMASEGVMFVQLHQSRSLLSAQLASYNLLPVFPDEVRH
jgi:hypothetical protein